MLVKQWFDSTTQISVSVEISIGNLKLLNIRVSDIGKGVKI